MQSGRENSLEERISIKFCFKLGKNAIETYGMLQTAFGASCKNRASVFLIEWHKRFQGFFYFSFFFFHLYLFILLDLVRISFFFFLLFSFFFFLSFFLIFIYLPFITTLPFSSSIYSLHLSLSRFLLIFSKIVFNIFFRFFLLFLKMSFTILESYFFLVSFFFFFFFFLHLSNYDQFLSFEGNESLWCCG